MLRRAVMRHSAMAVAMLALFFPQATPADSETLDWGLFAGAGYFNIRNSLYADRQPNPPAYLGDRWTEY